MSSQTLRDVAILFGDVIAVSTWTVIMGWYRCCWGASGSDWRGLCVTTSERSACAFGKSLPVCSAGGSALLLSIWLSWIYPVPDADRQMVCHVSTRQIFCPRTVIIHMNASEKHALTQKVAVFFFCTNMQKSSSTSLARISVSIDISNIKQMHDALLCFTT